MLEALLGEGKARAEILERSRCRLYGVGFRFMVVWGLGLFGVWGLGLFGVYMLEALLGVDVLVVRFAVLLDR